MCFLSRKLSFQATNENIWHLQWTVSKQSERQKKSSVIDTQMMTAL